MFCHLYWHTIWPKVFCLCRSGFTRWRNWCETENYKSIGRSYLCVCETMSKWKELSDFDCGIIVWCHRCGKSVRDISDILYKSKSTVRAIVKWKSGTASTFRSSEPEENRIEPLNKIIARPHWLKLLKSLKVHQKLVLAAGLLVER